MGPSHHWPLLLLVLLCTCALQASGQCAGGYYNFLSASGCGSCAGNVYGGPFPYCGTLGTGNCYGCMTCRSACSPGQYLTPCSGGGLLYDNSVCTNCTMSCPTGQMLSGTCSGSGTSNTVTCVVSSTTTTTTTTTTTKTTTTTTTIATTPRATTTATAVNCAAFSSVSTCVAPCAWVFVRGSGGGGPGAFQCLVSACSNYTTESACASNSTCSSLGSTASTDFLCYDSGLNEHETVRLIRENFDTVQISWIIRMCL